MRIFLATCFAFFAFTFGFGSSTGFVQSAHAASDKGSGAAFQYVELDPLMLPIVDDSGVNQIVSLVIALEVEGNSVDKTTFLKPKLTDAFIQDMYGVLNHHAAMKGGVLQISLIKERLNKVSDAIMGDANIVHDVLLQVVQQRPI